MRGRTERPHPVDTGTQRLARRCEHRLGTLVRQVGICTLDGAVHTWGDCPYAPSADGVVPPAGSEPGSVPASSLATLEQCSACAAHLRPNGGTTRWLAHQLDPYAAWEDHRSGTLPAEQALRRITPTGLLPEAAIAELLGDIAHKPLGTGPVAILHRRTLPQRAAHLLRRGHHHPDGHSIVSHDIADVDDTTARMAQMRHLGEAADAEAAERAAERHLSLRPAWQGYERDLWETANLLV